MESTATACTSCGDLVPAGKRFCGNCGSPRSVTCPACGAANRAGVRFCEDCGASLEAVPPPASATSGEVAPRATISPQSNARTAPDTKSVAARGSVGPAPPAEERRLVTALFCDLVGFTPLSEHLDPEEVRDVQTAYFEQMRRQIERYGGTVEKYAGDAVLALFGAPIAHEDDAERAVLCGLGMQAAIEPVAESARNRWSVEPAIRVGVNTGEVVSGVWDVGGRQDVAVTGDAVNTAARIQAAAEAGEVLVGLETMRLTKRRIVYADRQELTLKGKSGVIPGYRAIGVREQFGERWETSESATPLIGRDRELLTLLDAWISASEGDGRLVTLVGDAGVGKSRLMTELLEKVGTNTTLRVVRGRCLSYGQEISLWLIADILRSLFGIQEQDVAEEVQAKLRVRIAGLLPGVGADMQAEAMDVLGEVLGLPAAGSSVANAGAQIRRQALIRDLRLLLRALSERAATILVLEDLHWVDLASSEVLTEVLSDVPGLRLLVVAAQRPGWTGPWTDWGWTERLSLRPLGDEEAALLATAVLGGALLSPELEHYVAERAGGNPFFVEEMLRALEEGGDLENRGGRIFLAAGAAERLPSTLTEVLLARLDRLPGEARGIAQVASVIGRTFGVRLLGEVLGREQTELETPLTALQQAEIAFPRRGADLEYVFKHVSMRETAYNTLVQKRRQELHLAAARAIASAYASDEYVEMIAYHYARTDEHAEAVHWLERAGDRAAAIYANESALNSFMEARRRLELYEAEPVALARLDEKLGKVLTGVSRYDDAIEMLDRAVEAYRSGRDLESAGRTTALLANAHGLRGTSEAIFADLQSMIELLQWSGPSPALASLYISLARLFQNVGRYRDSWEAAKQASSVGQAIGSDHLFGQAEERRGTALSFLGHAEESRRALETSIPLLEAVGDLSTLFRAVGNLGESFRLLGDLASARKYQERCLEICERAGDPSQVAFTLTNLAEILTTMGDWQEAETCVDRAQDILSTLESATYMRGYPPMMRADLFRLRGEWDSAIECLREVQEIGNRTNDRQSLDISNIIWTSVNLALGDPQSALDRLAPLAEEPDAPLAKMLPILSRAHLGLGDREHAFHSADEAVRCARAQQEGLCLVDALQSRAMVTTAFERFDEARADLDEALKLATVMPFPYGEAGILCDLATVDAAQGETGRARERREQALATFQKLGARREVERVEGLLEVSAG